MKGKRPLTRFLWLVVTAGALLWLAVYILPAALTRPRLQQPVRGSEPSSPAAVSRVSLHTGVLPDYRAIAALVLIILLLRRMRRERAKLVAARPRAASSPANYAGSVASLTAPVERRGARDCLDAEDTKISRAA